jgi:CDP-paratose 2-epimerase
VSEPRRPERAGWPERVLVTGGAGFIGTNVVRRLVAEGVTVTLLDNLSRPGVAANLRALRADLGPDLRTVTADVRDPAAVTAAVEGMGAVVHLAGQTAVTTSIERPADDLFDNVVGTFNVLDAARRSRQQPIVIYASTNKVYGDLTDLGVAEEPDRYRLTSLPDGVPETQPVDPVSPYGCSKACGEQYARDFARTYGVPTVIMRQSCIYGEHQLGVEDQGWLAWFAEAGLTGRRLTIFGDGRQVRDLLHVDDLVDAYTAAVGRIDQVSGEVFNVGGGSANSVSIWWQLRPALEAALGRELPDPAFGPWRVGDQKVFVADTSKARAVLDWQPRIDVEAGLTRLVRWLDARLVDRAGDAAS